MTGKSRQDPVMFFALGIVGLFLAGFLMLVIFGAKSYSAMAEDQNKNLEDRATFAFLSTSVRANNGEDAVSVEPSEFGGDLLVIDNGEGYAQRIYLYEGRLMEDFGRDGDKLSPEDAQPIGPADSFSAEITDDGRLVLETDRGKVVMQLKGGGR